MLSTNRTYTFITMVTLTNTISACYEQYNKCVCNSPIKHQRSIFCDIPNITLSLVLMFHWKQMGAHTYCDVTSFQSWLPI